MTEVDVVGTGDVHKMLQQWTDPKLTERAKRATKAAANVLKGPLKDAAAPLSKRMAASVYVHIAKRDKPAYVVGHHRKKAFFWHMVIGGTKAHSLRPRKGGGIRRRSYPTVRGVKAHPIVAQVIASHGDAAIRVLAADLSRDE